MKKAEKIPQTEVISIAPFPGSKKIYVQGQLHDIQVAMREITLSDTSINGKIASKNAPLTVYDTSGPFTDPNVDTDVRKGLPHLRQNWILERGDVEELESITSNYGLERLSNPSLDSLRF